MKKTQNQAKAKKSQLASWETSKYWLGRDITTKLEEDPGVNLIEMVELKRAISNFVRITTGKEIPVKFNSGDQSYTDGKTVVISSKLDSNKFDCNAGLALHEAAHVLLTKFDCLSAIEHHSFFIGLLKKYNIDFTSIAAQYTIPSRIKSLLNVIEDRRIDYYIYNTAPGYRGYYLAMYAEYFNSKSVDLALSRGVKNERTWDDYLFHIINIMNPNFNVNTLPKLKQIANAIDLYNIGRLKSTQDALEVAIEVARILEEEMVGDIIPQMNPPKDSPNNSQSDNNSGDEDSDDDENMDTANSSGNEESEDNAGEGNDEESEDNDGGNTGDSDNGSDAGDSDENLDMPELTNAERKLLDKLESEFEEQKNFLDGKVDKKKVSKKDNDVLQAIDSALVDFETVNKNSNSINPNDGTGFGARTPIKSIIINGISESIINEFPGLIYGSDKTVDRVLTDPKCKEANWGQGRVVAKILEGIRLGSMLGKKLKLRNDDNSLKTTRLISGKIDRRLISELGYGAEAVFNKIVTKTVKPVNIHISIDASGSMSGAKFESAMKTASAIAKAGSMVAGVDVVISFRTTHNVGMRRCYPVTIIGYDSKVNKISHLYRTMSKVASNGATPEGLCFESILKRLRKDTQNGSEGIFLNLSDGMPTFSTGGRNNDDSMAYYGQYARLHTKQQCNNIRNMGYKILSYYVTDWSKGSNGFRNELKFFNEMYGTDGMHIDTGNLNQLSKSINEVLLKPVYANQ